MEMTIPKQLGFDLRAARNVVGMDDGLARMGCWKVGVPWTS
jgi:hypothetical protein